MDFSTVNDNAFYSAFAYNLGVAPGVNFVTMNGNPEATNYRN